MQEIKLQVASFVEALCLKEELVQPFEILLHHDVVGDKPRCIDVLQLGCERPGLLRGVCHCSCLG